MRKIIALLITFTFLLSSYVNVFAETSEQLNLDSDNTDQGVVENQSNNQLYKSSIANPTEDETDLDESTLDENSELDKVMEQMNELSDKNIDFSSKRLIVKGLKKELSDEPVIASFNGVYLLQYEDYLDAIDAYYKLSEISDSVEFDSPMSVASGVGIASNLDVEFVPMTEENNPFTEVEEVKVTPEKYDVAVIDTGATDADKVVSVLGDDGKDNHGHGQQMIDIIKKYAPEAKVLSIKALNDEGIGDTSAIYAAIKLAKEEKVSTINLSVSALSTEDNFIIEEAILDAEANGITVVGAAGNNGIDASLTVPGKIQEATIVGTTKESSNTGDTVDYYVPVDSTSVATATVTGLLLSDTLKDYEIEDKVIKLKDETGDDNDPTDPSDEFTTQDGGGGAGGGGSAGGNSATWTSTFGRKYAYVWFDRGGWEETGQNGALRAPAQGYYQGGWHNNPSGKSTYEFFIGLLTTRISQDCNHTVHYDGQWAKNKKAVARENDATLRSTMATACQRAINRNNNPRFRSARVVGVAVTYRAGNVTAGGGHKYSNIWSILTWSGDKSFKNMMRAPKDSTDDRGLSSIYGWSAAADPNKVNGVLANENWRDYTYRIAAADNASFPANNGTLKPRVYVVAVSDDFPPNKVTVKINKTWSNPPVAANNSLYSLNGIVFKLYKTQADARNNTNAEATFTTGANGVTNTQDVTPGNYYLVELGPPKLGVVIPDVLKAANGGKLVNVVNNSSINIGDTPLTGSYTVNYQFTSPDGTLPSQVMAVLPGSQTFANGTMVTATNPSEMEFIIGDKVYTFIGWDAPQKIINSGNIVFIGTWTITDYVVDDPSTWDDDYLVNYTYTLVDEDNQPLDEDIPDEVWDTIPADENDEYGVGDVVNVIGDPSETVVKIEDEENNQTITYAWMGWDPETDTFSADHKTITFTGKWKKLVKDHSSGSGTGTGD